MTVAVCWIVRDGADVVGRSIASVRPYVDELNVFLAGESSDGTPEVLARLAGEAGAPIRVEQGEWADDYAEARRRSFAMASPGVDWLMFLDDDDVVAGGASLRRLDELPEAITHVAAIYEVGSLRTASVRLTRPGACEWIGRVQEHLRPVDADAAFAALAYWAFVVVHPEVVSWKHDALVIEAAAADTDQGSRLRGLYAPWAHIRAGDLDGAEELLRSYLAATEGRFEFGRLHVLETLATVALRRGDEPKVRALVAAVHRELDEWERRASAASLSWRETVELVWFRETMCLEPPSVFWMPFPLALEPRPFSRLTEAA